MIFVPNTVSAPALPSVHLPEARCVDKPGLLLQSHHSQLSPAQRFYARADSEFTPLNRESSSPIDLFSVIKQIHPHVLIGTSTKPKSFTKEIIQEMATHVSRPIVLPLSNPTRLHEANPQDVNDWTDGRALIATGSPFPPVEYNGRKYEVAECNNSTCFPGIGLGCILSRARLLSDKMLVAACKTLATQAPALKDPDKGLLPDIVDVREISVKIAASVIRTAVEERLATQEGIPSRDENEGGEEELEKWVRAQMWEARYRPLKKI